MEKLTSSQFKALQYIHNAIESGGVAPTLRELCELMRYSAVGSAQDMIQALRKKGYLAVPDKQSARSLILTAKAYMELTGELVEEIGEVFSIPCLGSVPAGHPLEALEERIGVMSVSTSLLPSPVPARDSLFALRARGDSMMGAGIIDGDWLVVKSQKDAPSGSIVVARVEGEATVKRLVRDGRRGWFLKPENPAFPIISGDSSPFTVVGKVVALQRSL